MNIKKELNLKLSAESFDIKSLEIKDGKLELVLTAHIDKTEIDNSVINCPSAELTPSAEAYINDEIDFSSPLLGNTVDNQSEMADSRYGEPVADVEWQAVNDDSDYEEVEEENADEFITMESGSDITHSELEHIDMESSGSSNATVANGTTAQADNQPDILPDYLKFSDSSNKAASQDTTDNASVFDQIKSPDETPTVRFEREKKLSEDFTTPSETVDTAENPNTDSDINTAEQETSSQPEDKPKMVKFLCPRCHTPGSQTISSVGNIITCSNCGRALKLNIKR